MLVDLLVAGGGERVAVDLALEMAKGHDVVLVTSRHSEGDQRPGVVETLAELEAAQVGFITLSRSASWKVWEWMPLVRLLRAENIDVLHSHKFGSNLWASLLAKIAHVPVHLAHEHTPMGVRPLRDRLLNRYLIARLADRLIVVSEWSRNALAHHEHIPYHQMTVLRNGLKLFVSTHERAGNGPLQAELGLPDGSQLITNVAMLRPEKGQDVLIRALKDILTKVPQAHLVLVGGADIQKDRDILGELRDLAAQLEVADHTHFLGRRADVYDILSGTDVAVCSSYDENLPLAVLEYMAAGCATVATSVGGIPEILEDGRHGILVPPADPAALADACVRLLESPESRHQMGAAARQRQRTEFTVTAVGRRLERLMHELRFSKSLV